MNRIKLANILSVAVIGILVLLPFHALFTTWLGANFGHLDVFRIWKELILIPVGLGAVWLLTQNQRALTWLKNTMLLRMISIYVLIHLVTAVFALTGHRANTSAVIYALLSNLRFLVFFIVCLVLAAENTWLKNNWKRVVLVPAVLVIIFGLLQHLVLPVNFLSHFGYGDQTIPAYHTIDEKIDYIRVQSTLRGPNPLGAYLVVIISLLVVLAYKVRKYRNYWLPGLIAAVFVLFFTYSRSAWMGSVLAAGLAVWWLIKSGKSRQRILIAGVGLILAAAAAGVVLRTNDRFQNAIFHTDEKSQSLSSSNAGRTAALKNGARDVWQHPWGSGPGTAGPASTRNDHPPRIAENYYLQLGQEIGVLGMMLFIGINFLVGVSLWRRHSDLSLALLASLIGLSLVNLLSHAWGDDTLGLLWWGLAGIALAPGQSDILNKTGKQGNQGAKIKA